MTLMPVAFLLASLAPACFTAAQDPTARAEGARVTAIRCGALIDGRRDKPLVDVVLLVEGEGSASSRSASTAKYPKVSQRSSTSVRKPSCRA